MSQRVGLWHITGNGPRRIGLCAIGLEEELENWIERDPSLLQSGLTIVGRQITTDAGPLDLLAIDPQGRWIVIEVKRDKVGRKAIAQALDYASCIATMPLEDLESKVDAYLASVVGAQEPQTLSGLMRDRQGGLEEDGQHRPVDIIVVGTGRHSGLERMVSYLSNTGQLPITVVSFEAFEIEPGRRVLIRELTEADTDRGSKREPWTADRVLQRADAAGTGPEFRAIFEAATRHGLYPRAGKASIMFAPSSNRTRCLVTVCTDPSKKNGLWMYVASEAFSEFYGIESDEVVSQLGGNEWVDLPREKVGQFIEGLDRLFPAGAA